MKRNDVQTLSPKENRTEQDKSKGRALDPGDVAWAEIDRRWAEPEPGICHVSFPCFLYIPSSGRKQASSSPGALGWGRRSEGRGKEGVETSGGRRFNHFLLIVGRAAKHTNRREETSRASEANHPPDPTLETLYPPLPAVSIYFAPSPSCKEFRF